MSRLELLMDLEEKLLLLSLEESVYLGEIVDCWLINSQSYPFKEQA